MTQKEQETIDQLRKLMQEINSSNTTFRQEVTSLVEKINAKVEAKHAPISMEHDILATVQQAMGKSIEESLKGYASPLTKLITEVVNSRTPQLREIITSSFDQVIGTAEFKESIVQAFSHKVARTIISNNDGLFDKVANELKQDSVFKSKMTVAVSNVVEECLKIKNDNAK